MTPNLADVLDCERHHALTCSGDVGGPSGGELYDRAAFQEFRDEQDADYFTYSKADPANWVYDWWGNRVCQVKHCS